MSTSQLLREKLISRKLAVIGPICWALIENKQWGMLALVGIAHLLAETVLALPGRYFAARDHRATPAPHVPRPRRRTPVT